MILGSKLLAGTGSSDNFRNVDRGMSSKTADSWMPATDVCAGVVSRVKISTAP